MNKRIPTITFLFFILVIALFNTVCQHESDESTATLDRSITEQKAEEKVYSSATIKDDFCDI